ncbi:unnamed protein product [Somion occarium]|uniref:Uncharacterized protein n=1 Tax=Somion occarium TaxID=3059160 RepID=A0ABP1DIR8_9APHY
MTRCSSHAIHGLNDFLKACGPTLKYLSLTTASVTWIDSTGEQPKNYALDLQHNYKLSHLRLDLYRVFQEETLSWYLDTLATIRTGNLVVELDQVEAGLDYTNTLEPALLNMDVTKLTIRATLSGFTKGPSQPKIWEMFPQLHKLGVLEGCLTHVLKATG